MKVLALMLLLPASALADGWDADRAQSTLLSCDATGLVCAVRATAMCVAQGGRRCDATNAVAADLLVRSAYADLLRRVEDGHDSLGMAAGDEVAAVAHAQALWIAQRDSRCDDDPICLTGLNVDQTKYLRGQI